MIVLRPARPDDADVAAVLIYMTMTRVADFLFRGRERALTALARLFAYPDTRFGHRFAVMAEVDGRGVGMILAAPAEALARTAWPTARVLPRVLGLRGMVGFVWRSLMVAGIEEGRPGEYYVAHLAVLPDFQGNGIGSALLAHAEAEARRLGRGRVSLLVEIGHERARAFYEKHGYAVVEVHETPRQERRFGYRGAYRMVKEVAGEGPA